MVSTVESAEAIRGPRGRGRERTAYGIGLAHERFPPDELLEQARAAERAGFDLIACSDHLAPWWESADPAQANSGSAWVWLGALGEATSTPAIGATVTDLVGRYNPVVVARQLATLEILNPGRTFLRVGSGEPMNEATTGAEWPSAGEQLARTEESLKIIDWLLDGETVDYEGRFFTARGARLYSLPERRPRILMSAFGERAARIAGRRADGLWTGADPDRVPRLVAAYRAGAESAGREPGEIVLQSPFPPAADPATHVREIKAIEALGATVVLINLPGANPLAALEVCERHVLPALRD